MRNAPPWQAAACGYVQNACSSRLATARQQSGVLLRYPVSMPCTQFSDPVLRVAVPAPLRHALHYLPPAGCEIARVREGMRVIVPLGARRVVGVLLQVVERDPGMPARLRPAFELPDPEPLVTPDVLGICLFAARYYHAPVGEVIANALPAELRALPRTATRPALVWRATEASLGLPDNALARAPKQASALRLLQELGPLADADCRAAGIERATLNALQRKGLAAADNASAHAAIAGVSPAPGRTQKHAVTLNAGQHAALEALQGAGTGFNCFLLEGVTGSGKTEVYLRFIETVLAAGRQALVLVPEIGLTPQTHSRFEARFGAGIAVLHSGLGERERLDAWRRAADTRARVLIGTRSALFSPMPELGAIIVDEEHDASFKQQEGFRYSARDLAVVRARRLGIPVILGSATPSTESLANCELGRFSHLRLTERAGTAKPPAVRLIDVRGLHLDGGMCAEMLDRIGAELQAGNQVLVFLNRRGWAPLLSCADCGWFGECRHCDARLTLHRAENLLWCHHCDTRTVAPLSCPACRSARLLALGTGTERSEHVLQRLFPQYPIRRIDRGTMQARGSMDSLIRELGKEEPCILVGTQMLAKGHHFPAVTLVAIVDLDGGLFSADFRAAERTGQLLVQVSGRAGRADRPGEVLVQTLHPAHPWLIRLVRGGYQEFIEAILDERRLFGMPPYTHLALVRTESKGHAPGLQLLQELRALLQQEHPDVDVVGPVPATMQRRAGRHRMQLLLKHAHRAPLHAALDSACQLLETTRAPGVQRWHIDVDPQEGA
jgi:primosomal protein N' (replication factor Y) (superfamily II helicase)